METPFGKAGAEEDLEASSSPRTPTCHDSPVSYAIVPIPQQSVCLSLLCSYAISSEMCAMTRSFAWAQLLLCLDQVLTDLVP